MKYNKMNSYSRTIMKLSKINQKNLKSIDKVNSFNDSPYFIKFSLFYIVSFTGLLLILFPKLIKNQSLF
jgi:hypothetical protein